MTTTPVERLTRRALPQARGYVEVPDIRRLTISKAQLVYYSGSDQGPTYFGAAIVDNIHVNGSLVGHGAKGDL